MFLLEICKNLKAAKVPFTVVGGYALALHGIVRATMDVDLVISLKQRDLQAAEKCLHSVGLT